MLSLFRCILIQKSSNYMNTIEENIRCNICQFTCKWAERQLKNKLQQFLPYVLEKTDTMNGLVKPNIVISIRICDKEYYF